MKNKKAIVIWLKNWNFCFHIYKWVKFWFCWKGPLVRWMERETYLFIYYLFILLSIFVNYWPRRRCMRKCKIFSSGASQVYCMNYSDSILRDTWTLLMWKSCTSMMTIFWPFLMTGRYQNTRLHNIWRYLIQIRTTWLKKSFGISVAVNNSHFFHIFW